MTTKLLFLGVLLWLLALPSLAGAHTEAETSEWWAEYEESTWSDGVLSPEELQEYLDFRERHLVVVLPREFRASRSADVEQWRGLVESYFRAEDIEWAMRVMQCESLGDPRAKNPRSSASGLFQHLGSYWSERSEKAGWAGADIFDPEANVAVAAWLYYTGGPGHWVCK